MKACGKCGREQKRLLSCEHTGEAEFCVECYQELHYELTNR